MGIEIRGVTKRFGPVTAVNDLSLRTEAGELLAVVGPSGCGKTTLLRIIAGLEQADAGQVFIGGRDVTNVPPERRNIGFVFQQFALFPNMNVAENVGYGLRRRRVPRPERDRRVAELLSMIGMEGYGARRPAQLSSGQQQRVALARALAPEPGTLLLDEPLSALDAAIRQQLRDELRRIQRRVGITTVLVTHDQEEALAVADRVAVMNEGRVEQVGPPWELYHRPATTFVARFIGRGNFLAARPRAGGLWISGLGLWPGAGPGADSAAELGARSGSGSSPELGSGPSPGSGSSPELGSGPGVDATSSPDLGSADAPGPADVVQSAGASGPADAIVSADPAGPAEVGQPADAPEPATVLLRPESVLITPDSTDPPEGDGAFVARGIVQDVVFGGERAYVDVRIENVGEQETLIAAVPSHLAQRLTVDGSRNVRVTVPFEALRLLPSSKA